MRIRLRVQMSGTRDGKAWPPRGSTMEVPDDEGVGLCAGGIAEPVTVFEKPETATVKDEPETADEEEDEPETATLKDEPEVRGGGLSQQNAGVLIPPPRQISIPRHARGR